MIGVRGKEGGGVRNNVSAVSGVEHKTVVFSSYFFVIRNATAIILVPSLNCLMIGLNMSKDWFCV